MRIFLTFLITLFLMFSCGTGPWFIKKKLYRTYKENIYTNRDKLVGTNGYYLQVGKLHPNVGYRHAIIFYENGYTTNFSLMESELKSEIENTITQSADTIWTDLDWWKINKDSIIIEHYGERRNDMATFNYFERGKIISDSMIELRYDYSPYPPVKYKFIETDSLPKIINNGRYLKKDWYNRNLNVDRRGAFKIN